MSEQVIDYKQILKNTPKTDPCKPELVNTAMGVNSITAALAQIETILNRGDQTSVQMREQIEQRPELGITVTKSANKRHKVELRPIETEFLQDLALEHVGTTESLQSLTQKGVWGDPSENRPTYLRLKDSNTKPNLNPRRTGLPVTLNIDAMKLSKQRTVFIDPEPLFSNIPSDVLGESFVIFGGIPSEAITEIKTM